MYLKDADKGLHEAKGKFCSYNSPPFLPMHDDDLTSDVSPLMGNFQSKPFLQPRLAFNGLAFTANSPSLCLPSSTTSIFTGIPHLASSAELSAREGRVVLTSPTSILAPLTDESSSSSPLTKRRRYLPQLEPVSAGDQPLFVAPRVLYATNGSSPILNSFSR